MLPEANSLSAARGTPALACGGETENGALLVQNILYPCKEFVLLGRQQQARPGTAAQPPARAAAGAAGTWMMSGLHKK